MKKKIALITGITGQDGSYLAEFLIKKGYVVHGIKRRSSLFNTTRIDHILSDHHESNRSLILHYGDMTDTLSLVNIINRVQPDEIYNLAAQSHVHVSFETPEYTANVDGLGSLRILEAIRLLNMESSVKIYQASTSELYGDVQEVPQSENTPFYPRSPYGVAKLYAFWISKNYREAYNMFISNGILFNHESERRGENFVTRKITQGLASICKGKQSTLYMGNLDSKRDWGHAKDYVEAQWLILQHQAPDDFVIATGQQYSIREFIEICSRILGFEIAWRGNGINEIGYISEITNKDHQIAIDQEIIKVSSNYFRPSDVINLLGDASKAKHVLGWSPKYDIESLAEEMIQADILKS